MYCPMDISAIISESLKRLIVDVTKCFVGGKGKHFEEDRGFTTINTSTMAKNCPGINPSSISYMQSAHAYLDNGPAS
jgi:hypothetical protein